MHFSMRHNQRHTSNSLTHPRRWTRLLGSLTAILACAAPLAGRAATKAPMPNLAAEQAVRVGYTLMHMNYAEHPSKPYLDTENGDLNGVGLSVIRFSGHLYDSIELALATGHTRYDGGIQQQSPSGIIVTPYQGRSGATVFNLRSVIGPAFSIGSRDKIAVFAGVGVYYWKRDVAQNSGVGYTEKYIAMPGYLGLADRLALTHSLGLTVRVSASKLLLSGISTPFGSGRLGTKTGYAGQLTLDYRVYKHLDVFARARLEKFRFTRVTLATSSTGAPIYEPNSRTLLASYELGLGYRF